MNYPNGIKKNITTTKSHVDHSNRGMSLESDINISNEYYREKEIAYIYKKPTPIKIVKVDYPSRNKAAIKEAFFEAPSTTDYNGIYQGRYIDFEAKETKSKTSFPLSNIHPHQIKHIRNIYKEKGIAFLIVRFTTLDKTYMLLAKDFLTYIDNNDKKSIPLDYFETNGYELKNKYMPRIDYLEIIKILYGGI